ncbi:hypothetical protein LINPERHAP1_LOCUS34523 [Linum perenne]
MHTTLIIITDSSFHHQQTPMMKSKVSGLTSYNNIPITRKWPRESTDIGAGAGSGEFLLFSLIHHRSSTTSVRSAIVLRSPFSAMISPYRSSNNNSTLIA